MLSRTRLVAGYRIVTVMVIPERSHKIHRIAIPFFLVKLGSVLVVLAAIVFALFALDYLSILGRIAENKRLKAENYRLQQDLRTVYSKVESMESTVERVRNYAKKLQLLTGQSTEVQEDRGRASSGDKNRSPASKPLLKSSMLFEPAERLQPLLPQSDQPLHNLDVDSFNQRLLALQHRVTMSELRLSKLQSGVIAKSALLAATPSLNPIYGVTSSSFGYRRHPLGGRYILHAGIDIAAEAGTPVRAPADGTVVFSGIKHGYGKVVVIDHGYGVLTFFGHSSQLFVTAGSKVKRGEKIAEVGSTGKSTGPHLHYEIRKNGVPVNPLNFINSVRF